MTHTISGVEAALVALQRLEFPTSPDDDSLSDVLGDLSVLSSKMLAVGGRALRGEKIFPDQVPDTSDVVFRLNRMGEVSEEDAPVYVEMVEYVSALQQLRLALLDVK